jgi:hypothetical protein
MKKIDQQPEEQDQDAGEDHVFACMLVHYFAIYKQPGEGLLARFGT